MAQGSELNALGFTSLARKNLVIAIMSVMLLAITWQQRIIAAKDDLIERKNDVIELKSDQIVRCKEEIAPTVERLMLRAEMNGARQAEIIANQIRIEKKLDSRKR